VNVHKKVGFRLGTKLPGDLEIILEVYAEPFGHLQAAPVAASMPAESGC